MRAWWALALVWALVAGTATAQTTERFDGRWALDIVGLPGQCQFGYRVPVRIQRGLVMFQGHTFSADVVAITSGGSVAIRLIDGNFVVLGSGALHGQSGSGSWSARQFGCTGRWHAEKR